MKTLTRGLLIAMPQLADRNFFHSVVLMLEHGKSGAMGLVVNRSAGVTLGDLARGQSLELAPGREKEPVFVGGPVEPTRGFVLHTQTDIQERIEVAPGLFLSVTLDALSPLLSRTEGRLRFCLGYAGWGAGQVDREISSGAWLFTEAKGAGLLEIDPAELWSATLHEMGVDPAMLVAGKGIN